VRLKVDTAALPALLLRSSAHSVPPFLACTHLAVSADLAGDRKVLIPALQAAVHLTALQQLELGTSVVRDQQRSSQVLDARMGKVIGAVPATLMNLRSIQLDVPVFGASSARHLARLVSLTELTIEPQMLGPDTPTAAAAAAGAATAAAAPVAAAVAADLTPLSRLVNLKQLHLWGPPPVQPAAGPAGPYSIPSSLTGLRLATGSNQQAVIGGWVTHLPGCPHLQRLDVCFNQQEHGSAHPAALVNVLGQHNRQLRTLLIEKEYTDPTWDTPVAGVPDADSSALKWHPDAALAALTALECLCADNYLTISSAADWQHMARLSALTKLVHTKIHTPPPQLEVSLLSLRGLSCSVALGGREAGELLLACSGLQHATLQVTCDTPPAVSPGGAIALRPHSSLVKLELWCRRWGLAAAAHFAQLAPVLRGVPSLDLCDLGAWPQTSGEPGAAGIQVPDLRPCTALSVLGFNLDNVGAAWEQEDFLSWLAPLSQLRSIEVRGARGLNARAVVPLQHMLPQLQHVMLKRCGKLLPVARHVQEQQQQQGAVQGQEAQLAEQMLAKVRQLLRPGLVLEVLFYST
jgi:hypothetical protein